MRNGFVNSHEGDDVIAVAGANCLPFPWFDVRELHFHMLASAPSEAVIEGFPNKFAACIEMHIGANAHRASGKVDFMGFIIIFGILEMAYSDYGTASANGSLLSLFNGITKVDAEAVHFEKAQIWLDFAMNEYVHNMIIYEASTSRNEQCLDAFMCDEIIQIPDPVVHLYGANGRRTFSGRPGTCREKYRAFRKVLNVFLNRF